MDWFKEHQLTISLFGSSIMVLMVRLFVVFINNLFENFLMHEFSSNILRIIYAQHIRGTYCILFVGLFLVLCIQGFRTVIRELKQRESGER